MRFTIAFGFLASAAFVQSTSIEYLGDATTNCPIAANELCPEGATDCDAGTLQRFCNECYGTARYQCRYFGTPESWGNCVKEITKASNQKYYFLPCVA
ncbi:hypothetical protein BFW01_g4179 [Lasiodiplodia theobromae]|uniref:Uncharacterized protein n=1 Tax=Lasiodiplodia theobromae TaxID=45133 RepID=A0A5N5DA44_9PEZI|nr:hypothetical protein DBV05_g6872 [Lasiodiplodia theobromae]KAF9633285.1 hypothetical protein BFW01_g4179 [Lasiodiplodia theobromae]